MLVSSPDYRTRRPVHVGRAGGVLVGRARHRVAVRGGHGAVVRAAHCGRYGVSCDGRTTGVRTCGCRIGRPQLHVGGSTRGGSDASPQAAVLHRSAPRRDVGASGPDGPANGGLAGGCSLRVRVHPEAWGSSESGSAGTHGCAGLCLGLQAASNAEQQRGARPAGVRSLPRCEADMSCLRARRPRCAACCTATLRLRASPRPWRRTRGARSWRWT
jgi:hypothetical protein